MKFNIEKRHLHVITSVIIVMTVFTGCSKEIKEAILLDEEIPTQTQKVEESKEKLVEAVLKESGLTKNNNNRYTYFDVNLKGTQSSNEVIVYLWGEDFSGTGGGTMMIFEQNNGEYKFISKSTVVSFPIYIVQEQNNGFYDIVVTSSGGGEATKTTVLKYENGAYTLNASIAPEINVDDTVILHTLQYEVKPEGGFKLK